MVAFSNISTSEHKRKFLTGKRGHGCTANVIKNVALYQQCKSFLQENKIRFKATGTQD